MTTTLSPLTTTITAVPMTTKNFTANRSPFSSSIRKNNNTNPHKFAENSFLRQVVEFKSKGNLYGNRQLIKSSINQVR